MTKRKSDINEACQLVAKNFQTLSNLLQSCEFLELDSKIDTKRPRTVKEKKIKDPNAPHRNVSNYIHFSNEVRESIVKKKPNISPRDIARQIGEMWNKLSDKQKAKYTKMALDDKERFKREMEAYEAKKSSKLPTTVTTAKNEDSDKGTSNNTDDDESSDSDSSDTSDSSDNDNSSSGDDNKMTGKNNDNESSDSESVSSSSSESDSSSSDDDSDE
ncbi:high mobility group box domain-containing protein [Halteromyces radiatus]|uniref:high mobility group box domain-containing protein n=1 Tax=Halteromyces radiatus TaxID=101107 RepID=UPI002221037A|nr:high mobility group box domain-containing protein [Halteromyces radiatus]KAI8099261.1 high mobility group box domain-containing protein [Halteromyces radiatus]